MAFIIRSNAALKNPANSAGNIHGYYGPQDYSAMLDFTHQQFIVGGQKLLFEDALLLNRTSDGAYTDIFGRDRVAAAGQPRYSYLDNPKVSGLLLEQGVENFLNGDSDGSSFSSTNSGEDLCLSWGGEGSVEIVTEATITLRREVKAMGRTFRFYTRSGAVSGTVSVAGEAQNIMVANLSVTHTYVPHRTTRSNDGLYLAGPALSLVSDGTGSVIVRFALLPDNGQGNLNRQIHMAGVNDNNLRGALRLQARYAQAGQQTSQVVAHADGSAQNAFTQIARVLGNRAEVNVAGMSFENFGEKAGIISYLQSNSAVASSVGATPPTAFTRFSIVTSPPGGLASALGNTGVILTHCIIYDRMLSDEEALLAATFGA